MSDAQIAGRYRLEGRLGFGGMSTVHLALDVRLERQVAVKLLAEHLAEDPAFVSRFQREAQAAARLVHPNIVQVFDSGQDQSSGQYFIVMEYIQGASCAEILRDDGWVEVGDAIAIIEQACEGLDYAHRHGVVHRDVKPGNLLRSREGEVKLADFGIAKATEQSSITQVGSVLGTAAYLAPEQARGEEAGPRADLYALGVVAYQLISGRLPYEATSLTELALKQQQRGSADARHARRGRQPGARRRGGDRAGARPAGPLPDRPGNGTRTGRWRQRHRAGRAPAGRRPDARPARRRACSPRDVPRARRQPGRRSPRGVVTPRHPRPAPVDAGGRRPPCAGRVAPSARLRGGAERACCSRSLALLVLAGVVVAAVLLTAPAPTRIALRNVVYSDVHQTSSALQQLVSENTK